jgi:hypothetical protein
MSKGSEFTVRVESENPEHMKQIEQHLKENQLI